MDEFEIIVKCPDCEKKGVLRVNKRWGIKEWKCCFNYIVKWDLDNNIVHVVHESVFQHTKCAICGEDKYTPIRNDSMGGYICLTCIDKELYRLQKLERELISLALMNSSKNNINL